MHFYWYNVLHTTLVVRAFSYNMEMRDKNEPIVSNGSSHPGINAR